MKLIETKTSSMQVETSTHSQEEVKEKEDLSLSSSSSSSSHSNKTKPVTPPLSTADVADKGEESSKATHISVHASVGTSKKGEGSIYGTTLEGGIGSTINRHIHRRSFSPQRVLPYTTVLGSSAGVHTFHTPSTIPFAPTHSHHPPTFRNSFSTTASGWGLRAASTWGKGEEWLTNTARAESSQSVILGERVIEHEVRIPKKVVVEEVIEKTVIVPEKRIREEVSEDVGRVYEKIVEVAKPVIQEKIIEVPEYEYVDKIVEVPEVIVQEKVREVPRVEIQERIIEIPRIIQQEKVVEIPEIEYREIPIEKIVEVPEIHEQLVTKEIPIPQYVDKPVPEYVTVEESVEIERRVPVPVEEITTVEFHLPQIRPQWKSVDVPVYIPRFVEIPVPEESLDTATLMEVKKYNGMLASLCVQSAVGLCELEEFARVTKEADLGSLMSRVDAATSLLQAWKEGRVHVTDSSGAMLTYSALLNKNFGGTATTFTHSSHHVVTSSRLH